MVKVFVGVLVRTLERILTGAQGGLGVVGDVRICGWCCEVYVK